MTGLLPSMLHENVTHKHMTHDNALTKTTSPPHLRKRDFRQIQHVLVVEPFQRPSLPVAMESYGSRLLEIGSGMGHLIGSLEAEF